MTICVIAGSAFEKQPLGQVEVAIAASPPHRRIPIFIKALALAILNFDFPVRPYKKVSPCPLHRHQGPGGRCTPQKKRGFYDPVLKKTQLAFSTQEVTKKTFDKPDAPHLVLVTILSCALVVSS